MDHFLESKKQNDKNIEGFNSYLYLKYRWKLESIEIIIIEKMSDHKIKFSRIHSGWAIDHLMEKVEDRIF